MKLLSVCTFWVLPCLLFVSEARAGGQQVLDIFQSISGIPRCSRQEERISAWLVDRARQRGLAVKTDDQRNVLVTVPASKGYEDHPTVVLQAHMDMVCQKTSHSTHDFARAPITPVRDGEWLHAKDTTLGADDGIGVALALAIAEDGTAQHPRLELLFTTNEEADMTGAAALSGDFVTGRKLINIDSEDDNAVVLGSAGGLKSDLTLPLALSPLARDARRFALRVDGLLGGHSGLEINKNRANATVLIARALSAGTPFRMISFSGGNAANVIPRTSEMRLSLSPADLDGLRTRVAAAEREIRRQYPEEKDLSITLTPIEDASTAAVSEAQSAKVVHLVASIPYGVHAWSKQFSGLPETSNNIGIVKTENDKLYVTTYQRSSDPAQLEEITRIIEAAASSAGASSARRGLSPAWPPNASSALYKLALDTYGRLFDTPLKTEVVHAGLECGYIAQKYPGMEIISVGPTLQKAHTVDERLYVPSVERMWRFVTELLRSS